MQALLIAGLAGALFVAAYFTYGRWVARRIFGLRADARTPAVELEDGRDFCPTKKSIVFGHHFTSIAGTGPIVGPAIAVMWGWVPAILWVVIGAIFIGAVHDMGSMVVSVRNKGRSIGDIAGDLLGPRVRLIFLAVLVMGLWIVLAIFGLVIAAVLKQYPGAIFPVLVQAPLAIVIGLLVHRRGGSIVLPSIVALAIMYASVIWGDWGPLHAFNVYLAAQPIWMWTIGLLAYAYVASVLPVWMLLQPRDYINALQLLSALGLLVAGLVVAATIGGIGDVTETVNAAGQTVREVERLPLEMVGPAVNLHPKGAPPMIPILFITIACGAISGFHCLVASGTTSKQICSETDAQTIGYGGMLTEGFLATLVILACAAGLGLGVTKQVGPGRTYSPTIATGTISDTSLIVLRGAHGASPPGAIELMMRVPTSDNYIDEIYTANIGSWVTTPNGSARLVNRPPPTTVELRGKLAFNKQYESWGAAGSLGAKVGAFVDGAANLIRSIGVSGSVAVALMGVLVASFAGTTMDTACRLQRYVIQELSRTFLPRVTESQCEKCGYDCVGLDAGVACPECGELRTAGEAGVAVERRLAAWWNPFKWLATVHGATLFAVITAAVLAAIPAPGQSLSLANAGQGGLILWPLFGATNQLLAGLAFLVIASWLIAKRKPVWFIAAPTVLMVVIPAWALIWQTFVGGEGNPAWVADGKWLLVGIAGVTLALEGWLVVEVVIRLAGRRNAGLVK